MDPIKTRKKDRRIARNFMPFAVLKIRFCSILYPKRREGGRAPKPENINTEEGLSINGFVGINEDESEGKYTLISGWPDSGNR